MTVHKSRRKVMLIILFIFAVSACSWRILRSSTGISCAMSPELPPAAYSESDKILNAVALSYLVYGCETGGEMSGMVNEILDTHAMGILIENDGLKRTGKDDPASAAFDTAGFISRYVGEYRFLADRKDERSGFYGAAFCDDTAKCVWITYAGSVTFRDALACGEFVLTPGLSRQEQQAIQLYETALTSDEVQEKSYSILLTGHSLGGALATMVACASGCDAVTINGADGIAIDKFRGITGNESWDARISNHVTSPQNGKISAMDFVQRLMFLGDDTAVECHVYSENGYTEDTHCAFSFIVLEEGLFSVP